MAFTTDKVLPSWWLEEFSKEFAKTLPEIHDSWIERRVFVSRMWSAVNEKLVNQQLEIENTAYEREWIECVSNKQVLGIKALARATSYVPDNILNAIGDNDDEFEKKIDDRMKAVNEVNLSLGFPSLLSARKKDKREEADSADMTLKVIRSV